MFRQFHSRIAVMTLSMGFSLIITGAAQAQTPKVGSKLPAELQKLYDCRAEADVAAKAACYDNAMDAFDAARNAGEIATVTRKEIEDVQRDSFGFNIPSLPKIGSIFGSSDKGDKPAKVKEARFEQLTSPIKVVTVGGSGKMRFQLENGQVWYQTSDTTLAAKRIMRKDVRVAHIKRAAMGSFKLQVNGKGPSVKVRRSK